MRACLTDEGMREVDFTAILEHLRGFQEDIRKRIDMVINKEKKSLKAVNIIVKTSYELEHIVADFLVQVTELHVQK